MQKDRSIAWKSFSRNCSILNFTNRGITPRNGRFSDSADEGCVRNEYSEERLRAQGREPGRLVIFAKIKRIELNYVKRGVWRWGWRQPGNSLNWREMRLILVTVIFPPIPIRFMFYIFAFIFPFFIQRIHSHWMHIFSFKNKSELHCCFKIFHVIANSTQRGNLPRAFHRSLACGGTLETLKFVTSEIENCSKICHADNLDSSEITKTH